MSLSLARILPAYAALLVLAPPVGAQTRVHSGMNNPETIEGMRRDGLAAAPGFPKLTAAFAALREHRLAEAERLAREATLDFAGTIYAGDPQPHTIIARVCLSQGRYGEALAEMKECGENADYGRLGCTKALALIGLGRIDEARRLVLSLVGTPEKPEVERRELPRWVLPLDGDPSVAALAATADILRATPDLGLGEPWVLDDLRAAEAITPNNPHVLAGLGFFLTSHRRLEEARVYYARLAALDDPLAKKEGKLYLGVVDRNLAELAAKAAKKL